MVDAQLILAPVGAGKTEFVLNELHRQYQHNPFARIWVLLATQRQEVAMRERLFRGNTISTYFNLEFFNFFSLYQRLLDMAGKPQRLINTLEQTMLLSYIIPYTKLTVFSPVQQTTGFAHIVRNWIDELKRNRVFPNDYSAVAQQSTAREKDLAKLYERYQDTLIDANLMDSEGQGWLALEALDASPNLITDAKVDLLIVDGFDQFSHTQTDLLAKLSKQIPNLLITLTQVRGREATIGRRFATAKLELERAFDREGAPLTHTSIGAPATTKHADLTHLIHTIFAPMQQPKPSNNGIAFLEAPTPSDETANVLRRVKGLLLNGISPDDILIAVRGWDDYRRPLMTFAEKYGLPIAIHHDEPLIETPFVMTLMKVLSLPQNDFPRRDVLEVLRSPYINGMGLTTEEIDLLEAVADYHQVIRGEKAWQDAITHSIRAPKTDSDVLDDEDEPAFSITPEQAQNLQIGLNKLIVGLWNQPKFAHITQHIVILESLIGSDPLDDADEMGESIPPEDDTLRRLGNYADGLSQSSLNMIANIRKGDDRWLWRDLTAIHAFKRCLRDICNAYTQIVMPNWAGVSSLDWDEFLDILTRQLAHQHVNPRPPRTGRILITSAADARGLPHKHVFILGLSEGIFPAPIPQDPLYLESERVRLNQALPNNPIKTQMEQRDDEGVFYELICLPTDSLTLSRPTLKDGKEWLPSPLWRGATAVYTHSQALIETHKIGVGKSVPIHQAVTPDEALTALSIGLSTGDESVLSAGAWLIHVYPTAWKALHDHLTIELGRIDGRKNAYNGMLSSPENKSYIADLLGENYIWSATRLSDQGVCGFRFFAKHLLKLTERKEPELGMDVLQRGSVLHAILEGVYGALHEQNKAIIPENVELAHQLLNDIGKHVLSTAPRDFGFRPTALWEQEKANLLQKLHRLIDADFIPEKDLITTKLDVSGERIPYRLEAGFGFDNQPVWIELDDEVGKIRVRGKIDRIDRIGKHVVVMDYKSGSTEIKPAELEDGRNYQMLVYIEAVRQIAKSYTVAGGFFWHLADVKGKGIINTQTHNTLLNTGKKRLAWQISALRQADFSVEPNKPQPNGLCTRYCEFGKLCRHYRAVSEDEE